MSTISLSLDEIYDLAKKTLLFNGCDEENANALSDIIMNAERDGATSHGLFRLPSYIASLKSKNVDGKSRQEVKKISAKASVVEVEFQPSENKISAEVRANGKSRTISASW